MNSNYKQSNLLDLTIEWPERVKEILAARNFTTIEQVLKASNIDLMLIGLKSDDIEWLKSSVSACLESGSYITAREYAAIFPTKWQHITFGCTALDQITRNGLLIHGITEIFGESGAGKSQICMQLALNVQLPVHDGGLEKGAVYICTEDAFPSKRLVQMVEHFSKTHQYDKKWLERIYIERCADSESLSNCVCNRLPLLMRTKSIGLIIIDSVAGVFRLEHDAIGRANNMRKLILKLQTLADEYECAVVCVNQVTASMKQRTRDKFIPSLGLAWSNLVTTQFKISKLAKQITSNNISNSPVRVRGFEIGFAPNLPNAFAEFIITEKGICDVPSSTI